MKKKLDGFTLIEMLIVLLVVSILLLLVVPNIVKQQQNIQKKGCDAYIAVVSGQVEMYKMDNGINKIPTIEQLVNDKYIKSTACPDGGALKILENGEVVRA